MSPPPPHDYPSPDALQALERLIVGRQCNGFDRMSPSRKANAYAELIRLGLAYGKVSAIARQDYPVVTIQRVSSAGRRLMRRNRPTHNHSSRKQKVSRVWIFLALAALLGFCLFVMMRLT